MAKHEDDGTFSAPWWKARCEKAEMDLGMAQVRVKFLTDENEKLQDRLQTPAACPVPSNGDDRRLAEIRARVEQPLPWDLMNCAARDIPYLLNEIARLRGTLASYADSQTVERKAESE